MYSPIDDRRYVRVGGCARDWEFYMYWMEGVAGKRLFAI